MRHKIIALSILTLALLVSGGVLLGVFSPGETAAHTDSTNSGNGAVRVNVNHPNVSGTSVSVSGSAEAGFVNCGGGGGGGQGDVCFCCETNDPAVGVGNWETCDISGLSYTIKNPSGSVVRSGSLPLNLVNSPSGCVLTCTASSNRCDQNANFSFNESGLPAGTYTAEVTATDCAGSRTSLHSFTINPQYTLTITKDGTGSGTVTSTSNPSQPNISCGSTCSRTFTAGAVVNLTATSASGSTFAGWSGNADCSDGAVTMNANRNCTATFNSSVGPTEPLVCTPSQSATSKGNSITFSASGGVRPYSWNTSIGVSPSSAGDVASFSPTFTTGKFSTVRVVDDTGADSQCGIDVIDIQANNSDGPVTITLGDSINLRWNFGLRTSSHSYTCNASGAWSGSKAPNGGANRTYATQTISPSGTGQKIYTITCSNNTNGTGPVSDSVTVNVNSPSYALTVNSVGASAVSIAGSPSTYADTTNYTRSNITSGTAIALTAPATAGGNSFSSWNGCGSVSGTGNRTCNVTMNANKTVAANYPAATTGTINITSNLATTWTGTGPESFSQTTNTTSRTFIDMNTGTYTLYPAAKSGYTYTISPCNSSYSCSWPLSAGGTINYQITYSVSPKTLTVNKAGSGSGTVTSSPAGISCGSDCSEAYSHNTSVSLTPSAASGSTFGGWSGCDGVSGTTCNVTMNANKTVIAIFNTPESNNASCVSVTAPNSVTTGEVFSATITMSNTGTKPWTTDTSPPPNNTPHRLGSYNPLGNITWGVSRIELPTSPVNSGQNVAFTRNFTAPATAGTYDFDWQMLEERIEWFGTPCTSKNITVNAPSPGTINVTSEYSDGNDAPTTWTGTGPQAFNNSTPSASRTYSSMPAGGPYVIAPASIGGYSYSVSPSDSQNLSAGGSITFAITYSPDGSGDPACSDGLDNDGDGDVDYPNDDGCSSNDDEDESDDPPPPGNNDPDFFLTNSGNIQINTANGTGTSNTSTIKVTPLNGFNGNVGLSVQSDEIPGTAGSDYTFNFNPQTLPEGQYSSGSPFSVTLNSATPSGTYSIVIEGVGGGLSGRTTQVNLLVNSNDPRFEEF